jgi:hypothetical protein
MDDSAKAQIPVMDRLEYEIACVREFAHSGAQLGPTVSREQRRERIRLAILREDKTHMRWRETAHTYAAVFEHVYARPMGGLPMEERGDPSRAWHPRTLLGGPIVMAGEASDDMEIEEGGAEEGGTEEEDDEVF